MWIYDAQVKRAIKSAGERMGYTIAMDETVLSHFRRLA